MLIKEIVDKYIASGHNYRNAQNLAAEEIVLSKISSSNLTEYVTLKGGIVMFNLTKSDRRVTQDIDFDLIRYSIEKYRILLLKVLEKPNILHIKLLEKPNILHIILLEKLDRRSLGHV